MKQTSSDRKFECKRVRRGQFRPLPRPGHPLGSGAATVAARESYAALRWVTLGYDALR